ncbi:solute:Na+ symporter, SSS family [Tindallia magadiensis]|uniref:Solute:Na+ symporter, SSS family n=1 Tax=Tindallia magadiensis TaxID=69895 RepID=A0A1I3C5J5_9FIRM|nr:sodium:solute symporter family protein [Tindallia magadiensis]SFH69807.1 solute:Na+ symporter, SSS family [Tindallia magadiensis]
MNKSIVYLIYFTGYTMILLFIGKGGFKRTNNLRDFFLANNSLGLLMSMATFSATWFSAASMQGVSGSIFAYGYNTVLYAVVPWFLGAVMLVFLATRLREYDLMTVPEYFYIRYRSKNMQAAGGIMIVIIYILYIIIQIRGFGIVISEFLDINYTFSILLVYLFVMYTSFGGLFSVARTDSLNITLIVTGIFLAAILILKETGGIAEMHHQAALIDTKAFPGLPAATEPGGLLDPFSKSAAPPLLTVTSLFGWGMGLAANPQYALRIHSAKSTGTALRMISFSVLLLAAMYVGIFIIGIGSRVLQPEISSIQSVDEVLPFVINNVIYSRFSGLLLISIVAAAISTANSQLLVAASGFSYDIYKNIICPHVTEEKLLFINRAFVFFAGTISLLLSLKPPESLLVYGGYIWGFFTVSFFLPLYGGLFWEKANYNGAVASFFSGFLVMGLAMGMNVEARFHIHPAFPGFLASSAAFFSMSLYSVKNKENNINDNH